MKTCFVIQCFDGSTYDKRYRETFAPAIERGGAKPVRADEVLGTRPVVEKIEQGLRSADVAFAEISEDNSNVFLELGYALSLNVPTVIVCDRGRRERLPFDIAHRPVNFYVTDAQSDYEKIALEVEKGISAALLEETEQRLTLVNSETSNNVDEVKSTCLITLLDQSLRTPYGSAIWQIQRDVSSAGISERMTALAIASLLDDGLIEAHQLTDQDGDAYTSYSLSDHGKKHLLRSYSSMMQTERDRLVRSQASEATRWQTPVSAAFSDDLDEDVPF